MTRLHHLHTALCSHTLAARVTVASQARRVRRNRELHDAVAHETRHALSELTLIV